MSGGSVGIYNLIASQFVCGVPNSHGQLKHYERWRSTAAQYVCNFSHAFAHLTELGFGLSIFENCTSRESLNFPSSNLTTTPLMVSVNTQLSGWVLLDCMIYLLLIPLFDYFFVNVHLVVKVVKAYDVTLVILEVRLIGYCTA
jgi:hypothetical protein